MPRRTASSTSSRSESRNSARTASAPARQRADSRKSSQRKRTHRRKQAASSLRRLNSAVAQSLPWQGWGDFSLPTLRRPSLHWPTLEWRAIAGTGFRASKFASLLLLALAGLLIYWTESDAEFYVYADSVQFDQLGYLNPEELYARADLEGLSIFWVEADQVKAQIESHPYVAEADVSVHLPGRVEIAVQEVSPVALWLTDGGELWLMEDGRALGSRMTTHPDLVRIIDGPQEARHHLGSGQMGSGTRMAPDLLQAALTLSHYLPGLNTFRYAQGPGLYFTLPDSQTLVYWGDGQSIDAKLRTLTSILRTLKSEGQSVQRIDVRFPNKPYYK